MARTPDPLQSRDTNPDFETHVSRLTEPIEGAGQPARAYGARWYRARFQAAKHVALGVDPGVLQESKDEGKAAHGIYEPAPGSRNEAFHSATSANEWRQQQHANSVSDEEGIDFARTGSYGHQQVSHSQHQSMDDLVPSYKRASYGIAAISPARPLGMDALNEPHAMYEISQLTRGQGDKVVAASKDRSGTQEERFARSTEARKPFGPGTGSSLSHATNQNVAKAIGIWRSADNEDPSAAFKSTKTKHYGNDVWSESNRNMSLNYEGETGAADEHMVAMMAGEHSAWGPVTQATQSAGKATLPDVGKEKGYAYHREVIHEAARRTGFERPKELQAGTWGLQKQKNAREGRQDRGGNGTSWVQPRGTESSAS